MNLQERQRVWCKKEQKPFIERFLNTSLGSFVFGNNKNNNQEPRTICTVLTVLQVCSMVKWVWQWIEQVKSTTGRESESENKVKIFLVR